MGSISKKKIWFISLITVYFSQSTNFFKNYDNYIVLKKDENNENKNNNEEQIEKYSDPKITEKLKSLNTSSNSEISHN